MKKILLFAATAMLFAACASDEDYAPQVTKNAPQAVAFDTYTSIATRSGQTDVMTTTTLQTTGFGVFAAQTNDANAYAGSETPDFMYNQKVTYLNPGWSYSPLKYWPNETTEDSQTENGAATSTATDVVSFFAYAPYVEATATTGDVTSATISDEDNAATPATVSNVGITKLSKNTDGGDPLVSYQIAYSPSKSVDLLWGVAPAGGLSYTAVNGQNTTYGGAIAEGKPLLSLIKPAKDQKIKFLFKHALARLGMDVVLAVDQISPGGKLDTYSRVYVNSVTITDGASTKTIPVSGNLNLNNATAGIAKWQDQGTKDLKLVINANRELNPVLIGSTTDYSKDGVTEKATPVIADGKYFMLIPTPGTAATLNVTIDYDVITKDDNVNGGWTTTNNVITKTVVLNSKEGTTDLGFINNKAYNLKLILGLTSVKLDAEVADWEVDGSTDVNLPRNND